MPIQTSDNKFSVAKWIVNPTAGLGTHTTIAAAIASSSSGDIILVTQGTYTEDITMKAGVLLTGLPGAHQIPNVTIVGKLSFSTAGTYNVSNIALQTNGDECIEVTGSNLLFIEISQCNLLATNNNAILVSNSNADTILYLTDCEGDVTNTGISMWGLTNISKIVLDECRFDNSGNTLGYSDNSAGAVFMHYTLTNFGVSSSGTGSLNLLDSTVQTFPINVVPVVFSGSGSNNFQNSTAFTNTPVAMTVTTAATLQYARLYSGNVNFANGNGTITYGAIDITPFTNTPAGTLTMTKGEIYLGNIH